jgi:hypothetical protein
MAENKIRPYAAVGNVRDLLRRYRNRNLPETIGQETLSLAGVPEGMISRTLVTFKFLGLLNEASEPTELWKALNDVDEGSYPEMLSRIIRAAYADTFEHIDPSTDSQDRIRAFFQQYQPKSQIDRMVTLFLALCADADIPTVDTPKRRATKVQQESDQRKPRDVRGHTAGQRVTPPALPLIERPPNGETKIIQLRGGGSLSLHASVRFFDLEREDRAFVV